jgi:hypothetical protein
MGDNLEVKVLICPYRLTFVEAQHIVSARRMADMADVDDVGGIIYYCNRLIDSG